MTRQCSEDSSVIMVAVTAASIPTVMVTASSSPPVMVTSSAAAHMSVTMPMPALDLDPAAVLLG